MHRSMGFGTGSRTVEAYVGPDGNALLRIEGSREDDFCETDEIAPDELASYLRKLADFICPPAEG